MGQCGVSTLDDSRRHPARSDPVSARPRLHPDDRSGGQNPSVAFALCKVLERLPTWQAVLSPSGPTLAEWIASLYTSLPVGDRAREVERGRIGRMQRAPRVISSDPAVAGSIRDGRLIARRSPQPTTWRPWRDPVARGRRWRRGFESRWWSAQASAGSEAHAHASHAVVRKNAV